MDMYPPTDLDLDTYPNAFFTSDTTWAPSILDLEYIVDEIYIVEDDHSPSFGHFDVNNYGEFHTRECSNYLTIATRDTQSDENFEDYIDDTLFKLHLHKVTPAQHDFNRLAPNFGFVPTKRIQKTIEHPRSFVD
jgi:hypothetical protein